MRRVTRWGQELTLTGYARGDLPVTEAWAAECLSLPLYPELTEAQQDRVVGAVRGFFGQP